MAKTEQELYEEELKNNPPKIIEELPKTPGDVYFGKLDENDKFQLVTRYLNDICSINKSTLQIVADLYVLIEFLCEANGIDVKAKKQELAKKIKAQMEENIKKSKEQIEKCAN